MESNRIYRIRQLIASIDSFVATKLKVVCNSLPTASPETPSPVFSEVPVEDTFGMPTRRPTIPPLFSLPLARYTMASQIELYRSFIAIPIQSAFLLKPGRAKQYQESLRKLCDLVSTSLTTQRACPAWPRLRNPTYRSICLQ